MIFGPTPIEEAKGAILAHSLRLPGKVLKKGTVLDDEAIAALKEAGRRDVITARLEAGDVPENDAAERLAAALTAPLVARSRAATGRVNLLAETAGLLVLDERRIDGINAVDESLTVATLPNHTPVAAREMIATIKVIPFTVPGTVLGVAEAVARGGKAPVFAIHPFRPLKVGLVLTELPGIKESVMEGAVEATGARVEALCGTLLPVERVRHEEAPVAEALLRLKRAGAEMLLIAGASAVVDRRDIGPAAIVRAGGVIEHFGMPVDPGNLLLLARLGEVPVLGLPGCARSPKLNGFDWVLQRLAAGIPVSREAIMGMGVGGLLTEIPTRPQPRARKRPVRETPRIAVLVLAAGQSRRMGSTNKLLAKVADKPLLRHAIEAALASKASDVIVVTGHERAEIEAVLDGTAARAVHNPDYAQGLSTSLKAGINALPPGTDAAIVCLGDMPEVDAGLLDRLINAFDPAQGRGIVVPTHQGKRGNPVLWGSAYFPAMARLEGDVGARHLIGQHAEAVAEIPLETDASLLDIDTPQALEAYLARGAER